MDTYHNNKQRDIFGEGEHDYIAFPRSFSSYRWYKPVLVALLTAVFTLIFGLVLMLIAYFISGQHSFMQFATGFMEEESAGVMFTDYGALSGIGAVAVMLPALILAALIVRDRPYSSYTSSRGGWNWSAFFKCLAVAVIVFAIGFLVEYFLVPGEGGTSLFTISGFIVLTVITPFQCIAEEYIFRGLLMQTFGAWMRLPWIAILLQAVFFTLGHDYDILGLTAIFSTGCVFGLLTWFTRGVEASSAAHIINNFVAFYAVGFGLQAENAQSDPASVIIAVMVDVVYAAAVLFLGSRFNWFKAKPFSKGTIKKLVTIHSLEINN